MTSGDDHEDANRDLAQAIRNRGWDRALIAIVVRGANPNHVPKGWSALYTAIMDGRPDVVECLLRLGADPNLPIDLTSTQLYPLHAAADVGDVASASHLIAAGADVNCRDQAGNNTPLHRAAAAGRINVAKVLVAAHADTTARDQDGNTPADIAKQAGCGASMSTLLRRSKQHSPRSQRH